MKIVYSCYGGTHSSVVSAAIHIGFLPMDRIPCWEEILAIPYYDQMKNEDLGKFFHMGIDEYGNEVYVIGMGSFRKDYTRMIYEVVDHLSYGHKDIIIVDIIPLIDLSIRIGGLLSRRLYLPRIGKPLTVIGVQRNYGGFVEFVKGVKHYVTKINNKNSST